ncbi:5044_t:CDS:1 [Ambispora gerdemannii]|uniref:5044_t:CDS:1 n=1 Tax=Ambispora gerdemannii TaxID=144530 RepID=A0A9N9B3M5_9GLOM|nr:5044_t:CDS:1 [Ambispora gerdemannii]
MADENSIVVILNDRSNELIVEVSNQICAHYLNIDIPTSMEYLQRIELKKKVANCFFIFRSALIWSRQETWKCTNSGCLLHMLLDRSGCSKLASKIWDQVKLNIEVQKPFKDLYNELVAIKNQLNVTDQLENQQILIEGYFSFNQNGLNTVDQGALTFQQLPVDTTWQNLQNTEYSVNMAPTLISNYNLHDFMMNKS